MHQIIFLVIAAVLAIAATVLAFIFIVPEKRREKMNAFGRFLQDLCSFKFLVVEKILQALYIFSTAFIVLYGAAVSNGWAAWDCCTSFWVPLSFASAMSC